MSHINKPDGALRALALIAVSAVLCSVFEATVPGQDNQQVKARDRESPEAVKAVTIPVTTRLRGSRSEVELQAVDFSLREDDEEQRIVSVRSIGTTPLSVAILVQDDVVQSIANEIKSLAAFIRNLPQGSRVSVGYIRSGSLQVRQKFTTDLDRAAAALRIPIGSASAAPYNPYVEVTEALKRFDSQPGGRRAALVISDGVDSSHGLDFSSLAQSPDADRAVREAQRRSVAIYAFYAPTVGFQTRQILSTAGQGMLDKVSSETGGQAFFSGVGTPVSFDPFLRDLETALGRQIAVTYLSTHLKKGFHRIEIKTRTPGVEIFFPKGNVR